MNKEQENIKKLSESFASELKKLETLIASDPTVDKNELVAKDPKTSDKEDPATRSQIQSCMETVYSIARNLHDRMDGMYADMYAYMRDHQDGHPFKLLTATHKTNYLKACGMQDDYEKPAKKWANASLNIAEVKTNKK